MLATGTLVTPNNTIDTTTGTISLKATFANQDDHLWPGQFVNTRVQVNLLPKALTIPALAVQHGPDGLFVYVVKPDQTVAQANIQVGYEDDGRAVVTQGLSANQTVVLSGQSRLAPGTHVTATDASTAAQPPAATPARPPASGMTPSPASRSLQLLNRRHCERSEAISCVIPCERTREIASLRRNDRFARDDRSARNDCVIRTPGRHPP